MPEALRVKLMGTPVPKYTKGEELFNWISHAIGLVIGLASLICFIAFGAIKDFTPLGIISLIAYALSIMFLYGCSMIYHMIPPTSVYKRLFRILDHNTIYVLIAGTYVPLCALAFGGTNYGIIMLSIELAGLLIGTILNLINLNNIFVKTITITLYIVMGWLALFFFPAFMMMDFTTRMLILFGGIAYTVGVIFYGLGKKKKWMHSVFHLFVLIGTIIQLFGVANLIILL